MCQAFAASGIVRGDGFFATIVDIEAGVFPGAELIKLPRADKFGFAQVVEKAVAEQFYGWGEAFLRHAVESAIGGKEAVGREDVEMRMEDQVIAEGVDGGDGTDASVGEVESCAEGILQGGCGGVEQEGEEVAALTENATQDSGDGEDELPVRDIMADAGADP